MRRRDCGRHWHRTKSLWDHLFSKQRQGANPALPSIEEDVGIEPTRAMNPSRFSRPISTPTLRSSIVEPLRIELRFPGLQPGALTTSAKTPNVHEVGIEPTSPFRETALQAAKPTTCSTHANKKAPYN